MVGKDFKEIPGKEGKREGILNSVLHILASELGTGISDRNTKLKTNRYN